MRHKRGYLICMILLVGIFLIGFGSAVLYCCEKTTEGAWCENEEENMCDDSINPDTGDSYRAVPTSCDATSYCKLGTCINNIEGKCRPNTPYRVCVAEGGTWDEGERDEIPQCALGCCLFTEQAAFVTQVACNKLSILYGLDVTYMANIQDELTCLAYANPSEKGACVFDKDYVRTCKIETRKDCRERESSTLHSNVEFHRGRLCTDPSLEADCVPTKKTTCVDGKDDVYFVDSCDNIANVYDSSKVDKPADDYWKYIREPNCGDNAGNKDSTECGDCDYYAGSTCKKKKAGEGGYGDYICRDLDCHGYVGEGFTKNNPPKHGETWCADFPGTDENLPGSMHVRLVCYNGDVSVELCDIFRQKICSESEYEYDNGDSFKSASCKINVWEDCVLQTIEEDCNDIETRDCRWIKGYYFSEEEGIQEKGVDTPEGLCVPLYSPGFKFWDDEVKPLCSVADSICVVKYKRGLVGDADFRACTSDCRKAYRAIHGNCPRQACRVACREECKGRCVENCECLEDSWRDEMNSMCIALGDCGTKINYIGEEGYAHSDITKINDAEDIPEE